MIGPRREQMGNVRALLSSPEKALINRFMLNGSVYMWHDPDEADGSHKIHDSELEVADALEKRGLMWKGTNFHEPDTIYYTQTPACFDQVVEGYVYGVTEGAGREIIKRDFSSAQKAYDYARVYATTVRDEVYVVLLGLPEEPADPKQTRTDRADDLWPVEANSVVPIGNPG
jgi:hypothetical protein